MKRKIHTLIEYQYNKDTEQFDEIADESYLYEGDVVLAGGQPTLEASDWAFYEDGTESGSVIIGTKNNNQTLDVDTIYLARFTVAETAGNSWNNGTIRFSYNHNGGGETNVTGTSSVIRSFATGNIADGDNTTQRISAITFISANGSFDEVDGVTGAITMQSNGTEALFAFQILSADVADTDTIVLNVTEGSGSAFDIVPTWPTITVNEAAGAGRIMSSLANEGGLASKGGIAGIGGGLAG